MARSRRLLARSLGLQLLEDTGPVGDYSAQVTPPPRPTRAGEPLGIPAFFRGAAIIVNMAAPMTVQAWRNGAPVDNSIIDQPDPWMTRRRFMARTLTGLVLHGNTYWLKLRGGDDSVIGLRCADRGRPYRATGNVLRYQLAFENKTFDYPAADIEHLRFFELPGLDVGLGPVQANRVALEGISAIRDYADNWFANPDQPSGVLSTDQRMDETMRQAYKASWYKRDDIDPASGPAVKVLGSGLSYTPYFLKPADAQWLEARTDGVLEVARILGLPGDYLLAAVEGSSLTYSNLEMVDTSFVKRTLLPDYLQPIEEALTNVIVRGQTARFDLADFLRPDAKTRADIDAIYLTNGVIDPNEVRTREGWTGPAPTRPAPAPTGAAA